MNRLKCSKYVNWHKYYSYKAVRNMEKKITFERETLYKIVYLPWRQKVCV